MSDDLFQQLAEAVRPDNAPVIRDITWQSAKFGVIVTLELENWKRPYKTIHLRYDDVVEWIEDSRPHWLEDVHFRPHPVTGEPVETVTNMTAEDYLDDCMTEEDWHDYLISNEIIDFPYDPE